MWKEQNEGKAREMKGESLKICGVPVLFTVSFVAGTRQEDVVTVVTEQFIW